MIHIFYILHVIQNNPCFLLKEFIISSCCKLNVLLLLLHTRRSLQAKLKCKELLLCSQDVFVLVWGFFCKGTNKNGQSINIRAISWIFLQYSLGVSESRSRARSSSSDHQLHTCRSMSLLSCAHFATMKLFFRREQYISKAFSEKCLSFMEDVNQFIRSRMTLDLRSVTVIVPSTTKRCAGLSSQVEECVWPELFAKGKLLIPTPDNIK